MFDATEAQMREAARTLCLQRGQDPDKMVRPQQQGKRVPQWTLAVQEVQSMLEVLDVINEVFLKEK